MRTSTWIAIIGMIVAVVAVLLLTGNIVLKTEPVEDSTNNSSKIVKIIETEPEYLVREAD